MSNAHCYRCDNHRYAFGRCPGVDVEGVPTCYQPIEKHPSQCDPDTGDLIIPDDGGNE